MADVRLDVGLSVCLARGDLPHAPHCILCEQEPETMQHLLVAGWMLLLPAGVARGARLVPIHCHPSRHDSDFPDWFTSTVHGAPTCLRRGLARSCHSHFFGPAHHYFFACWHSHSVAELWAVVLGGKQDDMQSFCIFAKKKVKV